ncbi:hypothetical protein V2J09_002762 [Rumex salicifolius]
MREESNSAAYQLLFLLLNILLVLLKGAIVEGDSLDTDREVLLSLKSFLDQQNQVNRGRYSEWNQADFSPCNWPGINCSFSGSGSGAGIRVTAVDLSSSSIAGEIFGNFSALTALSSLDLSQNTIHGQIPSDLGSCKTLKHLNLSHNLICGELNVSGLSSLEVLDLSVNRLQGEIQLTFPAICGHLKVANISTNNFTGRVDGCFEQCWNLEYLDLSANQFTGKLWNGFARMKEFSVSENWFSGKIAPSFFSGNCNLQILDLSGNQLDGEVPSEISNCKSLYDLNLWGNHFKGKIPSSLGSISSLQTLILGNNDFSRDLPESLLNCTNLIFLDLSRNNFSGDIPPILGRFSHLMYLILHANSFTGGIISSGILKLPNISRVDLSYNNFSGPLPVEISKVRTMQFLVLAYNQFSGPIPPEYGSLNSLQVLDLSFNRLTGSIPSTFGNLKSLLWLMLANNSLMGQIPRELGNCNSLLWLNLANNRFNGTIPHELTKIGSNPSPTFLMNRNGGPLTPGSGECLVMRRWIPADYPPFSFVYMLLTRKSCRTIWDRILKGYGLFPVCKPGTSVRTLQISGYLQLSGNQLSGEVPQHIGRMQNFSMFHLSGNRFFGALPSDIGKLPLVVLNVSQNGLSGAIPSQIGNLKCLQNLDLSYNNFSGTFPTSLNNLNELSKFNVSYNPLISGVIPSTGQLATFDKYSFLNDPLLHLPSFLNGSSPTLPSSKTGITFIKNKGVLKQATLFIFLILVFVVLICGAFTILVCTLIKGPQETQRYLLQNRLNQHGSSSSSSMSSPWLSDTVKVNKTPFTHADILKATGNFSEDNIIGIGGFGMVYRGVLPDGRQVAVKKQLREGMDGEREFRAEMDVFYGNKAIWPHPNLVTLYGYCLDGSQKILIYEYMEGGSLEDLISDQTKLNWRRRIGVAIDVTRALVFLHHECYPSIVHRDVKASNILLDKNGKATVTDFGLARIVDTVDSHVSTIVAGTVGYVAPEYSQTWQATTKGDVYSFGVLAMELATGRRAVDGGEECLVEQVRRVTENGRLGSESCDDQSLLSTLIVQLEGDEGKEEMCELLRIGLKCTAEAPQTRPDMKEVLSMLVKVSGQQGDGLTSKFSVSDQGKCS